ncbi:M10 family metallopeptidase C-terminal domain-containing protein [Pseudaestuariivita atlantica]|uniref:M10 family metallopeptidase C-terminal domain-containing protein n=1 Tax=Pseudaestuariivita atlantica TaxID=1317121 RepID=UPI00067DBD33|nr:M10 family metallopeptidase C-terminal domain-containing protein [Pseudaestuariivita atlantica]
MTAVTPLGPNQIANTFTSNRQDDPHVAALAGGGSVVAWESFDQDGADDGIYFQVFRPDGTTLGSERRANTTTQSYQSDPQVAGLPDGGFVVVWESEGNDGSDDGIVMRIFNPNGTPRTGEINVNTTTIGDQSDPEVAVLADGTIVVAWEAEGQDVFAYGVVGRRYDSDGNPMGGEVLLNQNQSNSEYRVDIAALDDGGFVAVWQSWDGATETSYGRVFNADMTARGNDFEVTLPNTFNSSDVFGLFRVQVAALSDGGFVVAGSFESTLPVSIGVYAIMYDAAGDRRTGAAGEIVEFADPGTYIGEPSVAGTLDGGFVATISSNRDGGEPEDTVIVRYNADGVSVGDPVIGNDAVSGPTENDDGRIDVLTSGRIAAVWETGNTSGTISEVVVSFFASELYGTAANNSFAVPDGGTAIMGFGGTDTADYSAATGRVLVDFQSDVSGAGFARFFDLGAAVGDTYDSVENAIGGAFADNLRGDGAANVLEGGGVSDRLYGRAGDDTLDGGAGADAIYGNLGADEMTGGPGAIRDRFIYFQANETGVGPGNRDVITDFTPGEDRIELSRIDADTTQGFKQRFDFIGDAAFSGTGGELRYEQTGGVTIVQADRDGDGVADMEIELTGTLTLTATDFLI